MSGSKIEVAKKNRLLGAFEEYIWLIEQITPRTIVVAAEIEGSTTAEGWRMALNAVQAQHPILSVRVRNRPGFRPYFEAAPGIELPLQILPCGSTELLLDYCTRELETAFAENDLLLRAMILHGEHRSTLLLSADHVAFDGRSLVYLIRDLIRALAGESLGEQKPLSPSLDELLGLPTSDIYSTPSAAHSTLSKSTELPDLQVAAKYQLEQIWLEPPVVAAITERAREKQTTVHGVLTASVLLSCQAHPHRWAKTAIRCASPVDNREMLGIGDNLGLLITLAYTDFELTENHNFWYLARQVSNDVSAVRNIESAARGLAPVREALVTEMSPSQIVDIFRQRAHAVMVSNYGRVDIPSEYGPLRLLFISPMVTGGAPHTQTISLATINGLLCMTNVSAELIPDLLARAKNLIISQLR